MARAKCSCLEFILLNVLGVYGTLPLLSNNFTVPIPSNFQQGWIQLKLCQFVWEHHHFFQHKRKKLHPIFSSIPELLYVASAGIKIQPCLCWMTSWRLQVFHMCVRVCARTRVCVYRNVASATAADVFFPVTCRFCQIWENVAPVINNIQLFITVALLKNKSNYILRFIFVDLDLFIF